MLKKFWEGFIPFNWKFGLLLILLFGFTRFFVVLYGISTGDNKYLSMVFLLMIFTPFIFLSKAGRELIQLRAPSGLGKAILAFLTGMVICFVIFLVGKSLYGHTLSNWFVYIGNGYPIDVQVAPDQEKMITFFVIAAIGMTFSPFGEELLYRGIVHGSLSRSSGETMASVYDSLAFALVHLAHFGIIFSNGDWKFLPVPAMLWVTAMFLTGLTFNFCKKLTDSVWGAVISHMGFNLAMTYLIFYHLY